MQAKLMFCFYNSRIYGEDLTCKICFKQPRCLWLQSVLEMVVLLLFIQCLLLVPLFVGV